MSKLKLEDTLQTMMVKMAEGNIGAITALIALVTESPKIDPQCAFGHVGPLVSLDSFEIYGSRIWGLYKDVCKGNTVHTCAMLRACQLGVLPRKALDHAIDNRGAGVDVTELVKQVKEKLEQFDRPVAAKEETKS